MSVDSPWFSVGVRHVSFLWIAGVIPRSCRFTWGEWFYPKKNHQGGERLLKCWTKNPGGKRRTLWCLMLSINATEWTLHNDWNVSRSIPGSQDSQNIPTWDFVCQHSASLFLKTKSIEMDVDISCSFPNFVSSNISTLPKTNSWNLKITWLEKVKSSSKPPFCGFHGSFRGSMGPKSLVWITQPTKPAAGFIPQSLPPKGCESFGHHPHRWVAAFLQQ